MALVPGTQKRVAIPHEKDQWFEVRRLSWRELDHASGIATNEQLSRMKLLGGDLLTAMRQSAGEQQQDLTAAYDTAWVLHRGIVGWSYEAELTLENIELLDHETATWAKREILALVAGRSKDETKNG